MMKCACVVSLFCFAVSLSAAQPRYDQSINDNWKFSRSNANGAEDPSYSDSRWEKVSIPHTWNPLDGQDGGNDFYRGVGWYRKRLTVDAKLKGKSLFLKFDAASTNATVYVNGKVAGVHKGGFSAFCFDVSSLLRLGSENLIAVKVSNAKDTTVAPLRGDFTIFGGMYRGVHLIALEPLSISPLDYASSGVYVKQQSVNADAAELEITTILRNGASENKNATIHTTILDQEGSVVAAIDTNTLLHPTHHQNVIQHYTVKKPHLWQGLKNPYLYKIAVEIIENGKIVDRVIEQCGLRSFVVDPEKGFFLNGESYRLHGVNRHQDRQDKGWAIGAAEHQEDYQIMQEMGCSTVRLAHYQQAKEIYDLCDRGGMVVWAELALVDEVNAHPGFTQNCKQQLTELIKQNYNHPSICFWSIFNELMPDANRPLYASVVSELNTLAKQLDPTRLSAMATRSKYDGNEYMNTVTDVIGYNVYRGWYEGSPEHFAGFADSMHSRFPALRLSISEYGAGAGTTQHELPPKKPGTKGPWHPEEWQSYYHEVHWRAMVQRQYLWGTFVWNMFDFASDGRSEGERLGLNDKGLVTFDRKVKKDAFYWYKAQWNPEPMVHITSKRFTRRQPGPTEVRVYSNCDSVGLEVNGKPQGIQISDEHLYVWKDIQLDLGTNKVKAIAYCNGSQLVDTCLWFADRKEVK